MSIASIERRPTEILLTALNNVTPRWRLRALRVLYHLCVPGYTEKKKLAKFFLKKPVILFLAELQEEGILGSNYMPRKGVADIIPYLGIGMRAEDRGEAFFTSGW